MNNRERMRASNAKAVKWLLSKGYDWIWLKPHTIRKDKNYRTNGLHTYQIDLWGIFDGLCIKEGTLYGIQIKTNALASDKEMKAFMQDKDFGAIVINVKLTRKKYVCDARFY